MLHNDRIDVSEGIDVNKTSVIFATVGIFYIKGLSFNGIS